MRFRADGAARFGPVLCALALTPAALAQTPAVERAGRARQCTRRSG